MTLALADELVVTPLNDGLGTPGGNSEDVIVGGRVRALLRGALEKPRPDAESTRVWLEVQGVCTIHSPFVVWYL